MYKTFKNEMNNLTEYHKFSYKIFRASYLNMCFGKLYFDVNTKTRIAQIS